MVGWKRIVITVGEKIGKSHLTYAQGASAELVAATTIAAADLYGLPVSTTQVLSSGVAGTMAASRSGLQLSTVRNLVMAWVLTLPAAVLLSGGLFWVFTKCSDEELDASIRWPADGRGLACALGGGCAVVQPAARDRWRQRAGAWRAGGRRHGGRVEHDAAGLTLAGRRLSAGERGRPDQGRGVGYRWRLQETVPRRSRSDRRLAPHQRSRRAASANRMVSSSSSCRWRSTACRSLSTRRTRLPIA